MSLKRAWSLVNALWGWLVGRPGAGGAVADRWNKLVAWVPPPLAEVWSLVNALWGWLVGRPGAGGVAWAPPPAAVGPRRAAPNPTAGREAQTRGLFSFVVVLTAFFIGLNAVNGLLPSVVPPGLALFSLLGLLVVLDGLSRIVLPARYWYWRFPTAVLVVAVVAWANRSVDKLQFENMAYDPWSRTDLRERVAREYLPGPGPRTGVGAERDGLVDEREARQAWRGQAPATGGRKPKLVVVCCSGGGARSLVWTATVLDRLGQAVPGFDDSVRVIAAGSAGGAGAGYYVKARYDRLSQSRTPRVPAGLRLVSPGWSETVPRDSESAVIRSIALAEIWRMFDPWPVRGAPPNDRGRELERQWEQLSQLPLEELRGRTGGAGPVADPRADHPGGRPPAVHQQPRPPQPRPEPRRPASATARATASEPRARPVRRLGAAVQPGGLVGGPGHAGAGRLRRRSGEWARPAHPGGRRVGAGGRPAAAGGPEEPGPALGRGPDELLAHGRRVRPPAFDRANGFRLATAARMSATAPMISPAVYLPSRPPSCEWPTRATTTTTGWTSPSAWLFLQPRAGSRRTHRAWCWFRSGRWDAAR